MQATTDTNTISPDGRWAWDGSNWVPRSSGGTYPTQPAEQPGQPRATNGLATAALVCGIIALALMVVPILNIISVLLGLVAIGLGIPAIISAKKVRSGTGRAIAALILAVVSILGTVAVNVFIAGIVAEAAVTEETATRAASPEETGYTAAEAEAIDNAEWYYFDDMSPAAEQAFLDDAYVAIGWADEGYSMEEIYWMVDGDEMYTIAVMDAAFYDLAPQYEGDYSAWWDATLQEIAEERAEEIQATGGSTYDGVPTECTAPWEGMSDWSDDDMEDYAQCLAALPMDA